MRRGSTLLAVDSPWKTKIKHDKEGIDPSRHVDKKEKDSYSLTPKQNRARKVLLLF